MKIEFRNRFLEFAFPGHNWGALELTMWGDDHDTIVINLMRFALYLHVPRFLHRDIPSWERMDIAYGFYFSDEALVLQGGRRTKFIYYPWSLNYARRWEWVALEQHGRMNEGWVELPPNYSHGLVATKTEFDWVFMRNGKEAQPTKVSAYLDRYEHRRRWLPFTPLFAKKTTGVSYDFKPPIGDNGSWKGGCYSIHTGWPGGDFKAHLEQLAAEGSFRDR